MNLVLFDIDGTLIHKRDTGGGDRFFHVVDQVFGIDAVKVQRDTLMSGMTDQQIIREIARSNGVPDSAIDEKMGLCMKAMIGYFKKHSRSYSYDVLPGVPALLAELEKRGAMMGLVTGNLEEIAGMKLDKVGLKRYFKVGGFGSDDPDRAKLVKIAMKKAAKFGFKSGNVFLVGDTPRDVDAGKRACIGTLAVATGVYPESELKKCGPDAVLPNLADTKKVLNILLGK
jgi:phosphoglycolate phosphatase